MKSHSHILSKSVPTLKGDQVEDPEDLNLLSKQVSTNLGHIYKWYPAVSPSWLVIFFLIFMGKYSIHWDNCSFLTHFTIISESACQCFLAYSLIELETVLVLPMTRQR